MSRTIWKYELDPRSDVISLDVPNGAELLHVDSQHETICVWFELDPNDATEMRHFEIFGTGHLIREDMGINRCHIGTIQLKNGNLIFHVYERLN